MNISNLPRSLFSFYKSSCFINKKGERPMVFSHIKWSEVVAKKEELSDSNWLYIGDNFFFTKEAMVFCNSCIVILPD